jgi:hypothetical protein
MKSIILIAPVFLLASCASHPPKKIVVVPAVEPSRSVRSIATVRVPEQVREYRFGRYVDPGDRSVMHEEHPLIASREPAGGIFGLNKPLRFRHHYQSRRPRLRPFRMMQ